MITKKLLDTYITIGTIVCITFIGAMVGGIIGYMVIGSIICVSIGNIVLYFFSTSK
jgi:hypothetical protein